MQRDRDRNAEPHGSQGDAGLGNPVAEARDQKRRHPRPHSEQLPAMAHVADRQEQRAALREQREVPHGSSRLAADAVLDLCRGDAAEDGADEGAQRAGDEPDPVIEQRDQSDREADRADIAGRHAREHPAHAAATPGRRQLLRDQHDRRRVGAALGQAHQSVKPERFLVGAGAERERQRGQRARPAGPDEHAPRPDVVSQPRGQEQRDAKAGGEAGLHQPGLGRRHRPFPAQGREAGGIGHENQA